MQVQEIYLEVKGYSIRKSTADILVARILTRAQVLSDYPAYTLKQLCGHEFWRKNIPEEERRVAGMFVLHEAAMGRLPIRRVDRAHEYPVYYRLITDFNY